MQNHKCTTLSNIPHPNKFSGIPSLSRGFLFQCSLYFAGQTSITDQQKIAQFLNLLTDKALKWATAVYEKGCESIPSYNHCNLSLLLSLWPCPQGENRRWAAPHNHAGEATCNWICFGILYTPCRLYESALKAVFWQGLYVEVLKEWDCHEISLNIWYEVPLNSLIDLAICLDNIIKTALLPRQPSTSQISQISLSPYRLLEPS